MSSIGPRATAKRTPPRPVKATVELLRSLDPEAEGMRRAARAAVTVPAAAALSLAISDGTEAPLYTLLGAFWLMIFTEFPGNRQNRAVGYLGLGCNGLILITVGTAVAPFPWLAAALTFVLGAAITLAGVLSETVSAGQRATLLLYLWPACTPVGPIGQRLLGWSIALVICVPAALFVMASRHHGALRNLAARVCTTLADRLDGVGGAADVTRAMDALYGYFLATNVRPVGLTAGSQALVRVVDNLRILRDRIDDAGPAALGPINQPAIAVLRSCATVLVASPAALRADERVVLDGAVTHLRSIAGSRYREDATRILAATGDDAAVITGRQVLSRQTIATAIALTGSVVAAAAAADARPVWARALGLGLPKAASGYRLLPEPVAIAAIPTELLATRSVAARNSIRAGVGLALAVVVSHLFAVQHGFWVVLGAMTVLGSSALSTGTKVIQAVIGTAVGVSLGGVLIQTCGVEPAMLWILLPVTVFGSAYLPRASFTAGQAAIAMTVLVILNLIAPTGWRIGLLRIEDVALGAAVAVIASLLLWPRGATAAITTVMDMALQVNARYLNAGVQRVTRGASSETDRTVEALGYYARAADRAVDDAVRHYLSETGSQANLRTPVVQAANRITHLRITAETISDIHPMPPGSAYSRARALLESHARSASARLRGTRIAPPAPVIDQLVPALRSATHEAAAVDAALPLLTVGLHLGELELTYRITTTTPLS